MPKTTTPKITNIVKNEQAEWLRDDAVQPTPSPDAVSGEENEKIPMPNKAEAKSGKSNKAEEK